MTKPLDQQLTYKLHLLGKLSDVRSQQIYLERAGLSLSEARSLTAIGTFAPLSINELAYRSNLTKSQASRAAQAMVDKQLVVKKGTPEDGRGIELTLSNEGQRIFKKVIGLVDVRNHEIFACLSPSETDQLSNLIDRVIQHLR